MDRTGKKGADPMSKTITLAALTLLIGLGCKHEQMASRTAPPSAPAAARAVAATPQPAIAKDTSGRVICHIVSRHETITVKSGDHGVIYSIRDAEGKLTLADATPEEFQRFNPQLFGQVQHYIAVQADTAGAIEASGDIRAAPVPWSDSRRD